MGIEGGGWRVEGCRGFSVGADEEGKKLDLDEISHTRMATWHQKGFGADTGADRLQRL